MKKLFIFLFVIPLFFSCKNKEAEALKLKNDSLALEVKLRDSTVNNFFESFNQIEANLDTIKKKEKIITVSATGSEVQQDTKDRINGDIQMIYDLMQKNKNTISRLKRQLKKSDIKIAQLEKMIESLTRQLGEKDVEITALKDKLEKMNIQITALVSNVDSLNNVSKNKENVINQKTDVINTAYYVFGTKKELIDNKVIQKEGGLFNKTTKMADNFNKDYFTKIDIRKTTSIELHAKKATLLTTHPASSYKIEGTKVADKLVITNAEEFWSVSKYLVIVVEN
jgi:chromosome segregation ATPase